MTSMPEAEIRLEEVPGGEEPAADVAAPRSAPTITLRFRVEADSESLVALRQARRSLLREEATRGLDVDEPSLEHAAFSPAEISWEILPSQRARCLEKLEELLSRARRARESPLSFSDTLSRRSTRT